MVHQTEKQLEEFGDKVPAADKEAIETALNELKEVKDGEDLEAIQQKTQALVQATMKLGEAMYAAQQAEAGAEGETSDSAADDEVVDAEFSEVDDKDDAKKDA
jgi:molecular chaperone DnaK